MKNLIEFLSTHSVNYAFTSGILLTVLIVAIACIIILYLRLKEAKTWIKFSEIEKQQNRTELKEEKSFCETQGSMYSKLLVRHAELKQGFEDAVAEITELRSKAKISEDELRIAYERIEAMSQGNKVLIDKNKLLNQDLTAQTEQIAYWKERALHQKHTKKEVNNEWYECISDNMAMFVKGIKYRDSGRKTLSSLVWLENNGHNYLTHKQNFKPVNP